MFLLGNPGQTLLLRHPHWAKFWAIPVTVIRIPETSKIRATTGVMLKAVRDSSRSSRILMPHQAINRNRSLPMRQIQVTAYLMPIPWV